MKILFLCGSLEPGRDGVGDYTRRLAGELIRKGHQVQMVALYDRYTTTLLEEDQLDEYERIPTFRFPAVHALKQNIKEAIIRVEEINPDWISLQFVPFAFQAKGLPFGMANAIRQLTKAYKFHIMFHELWVGMNKEAPFKLFCLGKIQKRLINSFLRKSVPGLVHTHVDLYQRQLIGMGFNAKKLPLFSNISIEPNSIRLNHADHLRFVFFGTIHPHASILAFTNWLAELERRNNHKIIVLFIGKNGAELKSWQTILKNKSIKTEIHPELSKKNISQILWNSDIGTTNPPLLAEKSGTVASMLEHGLPVISISESWTVNFPDINSNPLGLFCFNSIDDLSELKRTQIIGDKLNKVAAVLLRDFQDYNNCN